MSRSDIDSESIAVCLSDGLIALFGEGSADIQSEDSTDPSIFVVTLPSGAQRFRVTVEELIP